MTLYLIVYIVGVIISLFLMVWYESRDLLITIKTKLLNFYK